MKYCLSFLILLSVPFRSAAQNWECLQSGVARYFINTNGYLRGMRIDSVVAAGGVNTYYPFHTARRLYGAGQGDSTGGSWLCKAVIRQSDGTFFFDNLWNDTVVIKSLASLGDSWVFYNDSSNRSYMAQVTAVDTQTILGTADSIKKIKITALQGTQPLLTDPANNLELIISKGHGFVVAIDLYTFPYRLPGQQSYTSQVDYYLDYVQSHYGLNAAGQTFRLVPFTLPTHKELNDFEVGDAHTFTAAGYINFTSVYTTDTRYDSILSKTVINGPSPGFTYNVSWKTYHSYSGQSGSGHSSGEGTGTLSLSADTLPAFQMPKMPEEWGVGLIYWYNPQGPACDTTQRYYKMANDGGPSNGYRPFEYCDSWDTYVTGLGHSEHGCNWWNIEPTATYTKGFVYQRRNGIPCGPIIIPVGIDPAQLPDNVRIFPSPAADWIEVDFRQRPVDSYLITLCGLDGRVLLAMSGRETKARLSVAALPDGIYMLRVGSPGQGAGVFKVTVLH